MLRVAVVVVVMSSSDTIHTLRIRISLSCLSETQTAC